MDNRDKKVNNRAGNTAHNTQKDMKEKILIIGKPGTGKTDLGNVLSELMNYDLVDEVADGGIELMCAAKPRTIYISSSISGLEALMQMEDFTIIEMYNV